MTKKERAYIQAKANRFGKWYEEEIKEARKAQDAEETEEHYVQARMNSAIQNALENLLAEL